MNYTRETVGVPDRVQKSEAPATAQPVTRAKTNQTKSIITPSNKADDAIYFDDAPSAFNAHMTVARVLVQAGWHRTETGFSKVEKPHFQRVELRPDGVAVAHRVPGVCEWRISPTGFGQVPTIATPWALWLHVIHYGDRVKASKAALKNKAVQAALGGAA